MPLIERKKQGFASMDKARQREIASMGGRRAHELGVAHEWNQKTASAAGRKGGQTQRRKKDGNKKVTPDPQTPKPAA